MDKQDALDLIAAVRSGEFEDATIEVKRARRGLPQRLYEALSAFANRPTGGVIVLGLDEAQQFAVTGVEDVQTVLTELTTLSARMMPPIALDVAVVEVEEQRILVAEVPECDYLYKPCYYAPSGLQSGAFFRVGNENRRMTEYEIFSYVTGRGQPLFDRAFVPQATLADLNSDLLSAYLAHVKQQRGSVWHRLRLDDKTQVGQLLALEIVGQDDQGVHPTLAGLLVFGLWPQRFYPALMITFVRYPGVEAGGKGPRGERFLDNAQFEGALPELIEQAVQRCLLNMRQSTLIEGIFHRTLPEYPEEALREALVNAVVHRDYSPFVVGSQVRLEMYDDAWRFKALAASLVRLMKVTCNKRSQRATSFLCGYWVRSAWWRIAALGFAPCWRRCMKRIWSHRVFKTHAATSG